MHPPHTPALCTWLMDLPLALASCTCPTHLSHAPALCTGLLGLPLAPAPCTCPMHLPYAPAPCTYTMHLPHAPALSTCPTHLPQAWQILRAAGKQASQASLPMLLFASKLRETALADWKGSLRETLQSACDIAVCRLPWASQSLLNTKRSFTLALSNVRTRTLLSGTT